MVSFGIRGVFLFREGLFFSLFLGWPPAIFFFSSGWHCDAILPWAPLIYEIFLFEIN